MHPHDIELIKRAILRLKEKGNTILIVEHNPALIAIGDNIVEVGPGAGTTGGHITFTGTYQALLDSDTLTGKLLKQPLTFRQPRPATSTISLQHIHRHNLKDVSVAVPLGIETVISGVAGSGKSTLVSALRDQLTAPYIDLAQAISVLISAQRLPHISQSSIQFAKSLLTRIMWLAVGLVTTVAALAHVVRVKA